MPEAAEKSKPESGPKPLLGTWIERIGAALVAPALALQASDSPEGQGRSSSDITILLLLTVVAVQTDVFVTAGWMIGDGDFRGALTVILVGSRQRLLMPILLMMGASLILTLVAGRRRSIARDFDLVCVALTPLVVVELVNSLVAVAGFDVHQVSAILGYCWALFSMFLAFKQTRSRALQSGSKAST